MVFGVFKRKKVDTRTPPATANPSLSASDEEMIRATNAAIDAYDRYLERHPIGFDIRNVSDLPRPKLELVNAIRVALVVERNESVRQFLLEIGLKLAFFQEGIGQPDLSFSGPIARLDLDKVPAEKLIEAMERHRPEFERHHSLAPGVLAEMRNLAALYDQSIAVARMIPSEP